MKRRKARGPVQRDAKEVLAEVLEKLTGKLDAPAVSTSAKENRKGSHRIEEQHDGQNEPRSCFPHRLWPLAPVERHSLRHVVRFVQKTC